MKPIKIAFLWHQHQPYYRKDNEFILPWVRLHGVKDYFDLPELLFEFPKIKQTINLVPSLMIQIDEYLSGEAEDRVLKLSKKDPEHLSISEKKEIIKLFFLCNEENMIFPYKRYNELYNKSKNENSYANFSSNDFLDLQVWYLLTWIGPISRNSNFIQRLFIKSRDFTISERDILIDFHFEILSKIKKNMINLSKLGQIELSCSPLFHPILPLLCDSNSMHEAMSDKPLPNPVYKFKEDADFQISAAKEYFNSNFSQNPSGFWPSEGSISNEVLNLMIKNGIKWVATDEEILHNSLNHKQHHLDKYFPWIYENENGEQISIIFRDHYLSDSIGFQYSRWNPFDAANDFIGKILNIRNELINNFGGDILDKACIPIILDGENCWEFYKENGVHFLRELYKQLSENDLIETITFSESLNYCDRKLQSVTAGSWINANFNIWMGHSEHIEAWSMLGRIRNLIETKKNVITLDKYKEALKIIYIAEGSDWFWWYGDSHFAPNKYDFDVLFRYHIAKIHEIIGEEIPMNVYEPISLVKKADLIIYPIEKISPELDDDLNWDNSGIINVKLNMSTMHQIGEILDSVNFQFDDLKFYLRLGFARKLNNNDNIEIDFNGEKLIYSIDSISKSDQDFAFNYNDYLYFLKNLNENKICKISIKIINSDGTILYPWQGEYKINL